MIIKYLYIKIVKIVLMFIAILIFNIIFKAINDMGLLRMSKVKYGLGGIFYSVGEWMGVFLL